MDFSSVLPTFVITLREGVEAALVVGIVLACLQKAGRTRLNLWVYVGIAAGIGVSALIGLLFSWLISALGAFSPAVEPLMEAVFSLVAVLLLSWMLIWMTRQASLIKSTVEGELAAALSQGRAAGWAVFSLVFFAVLREGFGRKIKPEKLNLEPSPGLCICRGGQERQEAETGRIFERGWPSSGPNQSPS